MKLSKIFLTTISLFLLLAFTTKDAKKRINFSVELTDCEKIDSLFLYEFDGVLFKKIKSSAKEEGSKFMFEMPKSSPRFYYIGTASNNVKPFIFGTEKDMSMKGSCRRLRQIEIDNSSLNNEYDAVKVKMKALQNEMGQYVRTYGKVRNNPEKKKAVDAQLAGVDKKRLALLDSLKKANPYLSKVVALNTYLSYQNNAGVYVNEIDYFADKYFEFADWADEDYNYLPWVYEGAKSYATTLSSINLAAESHKKYLESFLSKIPEDTRTYKLAIGGILAALQSKSHGNYAHFGKKFVEKYKSSDMTSAAQVNKEVKRLGAFSIGGEAPDFTMNDTDGEPRKLSEFRGKVLLVDFWASWCGPCRRENPHVKKMYSKYNEKGFDILGVSLDKQRGRWVDAIEKDGLPWHHVSDLKGWKNEAAQLYNVRSIPHTILLDNEGKIIAKNLRGPSLEAKLKEIFGH